MYLPHNISLSSPHVAVWFGSSGKQYNFAVTRARPMWLGQPAVYVLVRCAGDRTEGLFVGRAEVDDAELGGIGSEGLNAWEQALAMGMTHAHLRFEACSDAVRQGEVDDLVAALDPVLNRERFAVITVSQDEPVALAGTHDEAPLVPAVASRAVSAERSPPVRLARTTAFRRFPRLALGGLLTRILAKTRVAPTVRVASTAAEFRAVAMRIARAAAPPVAAEEGQEAGGPAVEPAATVTSVVRADPAPVDPRAALGFGGDGLLILFAGELAYAAGADLVVEAMATVATDVPPVRLIVVGEGPLHAELEERTRLGGFGHACRLVGHLPAVAFADIFAVSDALVIPARAPQDPALAERARAAGKPVLTTHQARLDAIVHGENGLVTYDNPGSLVWVLREAGSFIARRSAIAAFAA